MNKYMERRWMGELQGGWVTSEGWMLDAMIG